MNFSSDDEESADWYGKPRQKCLFKNRTTSWARSTVTNIKSTMQQSCKNPQTTKESRNTCRLHVQCLEQTTLDARAGPVFHHTSPPKGSTLQTRVRIYEYTYISVDIRSSQNNMLQNQDHQSTIWVDKQVDTYLPMRKPYNHKSRTNSNVHPSKRSTPPSRPRTTRYQVKNPTQRSSQAWRSHIKTRHQLGWKQ